MKKNPFRSFVLLIAAILFTLAVLAHEFWLQPDKFIYKQNQSITVKFLVGENFTGDNWSGNNTRINSLRLFKADSITDISSLMSDAKGDSLQLSIAEQGTAMIAFNSNNSFIKLEPEKFNAYLMEDGLADALDYRREHNEVDSAGREFYQRSVKTIFQVGSNMTEDYKKPTGLPLDIILKTNPYSIHTSGKISFKVLFKGKPLINNLCRIWFDNNGQISILQQQTDKKGEISISVQSKGRWMISTVKMIHIKDPMAQWQSYWGSVTWGYK